jgi:hypothetical protein
MLSADKAADRAVCAGFLLGCLISMGVKAAERWRLQAAAILEAIQARSAQSMEPRQQ